MAKTKTVFFCTECGNETPKWAGKCPACGSWNTLVEGESSPKKSVSSPSRAKSRPVPISEVNTDAEIRFSTGFSELDRVLGGGVVDGSLVLVGGAPGIGKSTLLLQLCGVCAKDRTVLYVTGEESGRQIKLRADRLGVNAENLLILVETDLNEILSAISSVSPDIVIIDSIQTLYDSELDSMPGSVGQIKDCTAALMQVAKGDGITVFIVGHINKEGNIAGPKVLEHMVDCVLYFEGDRLANYRILRAVKNRFGSTNEIGLFEMVETGLTQVPNMSELLLSDRPSSAPGTCVTCVMEGTRPLLAEIQALVTPTSFNVPRRTSNGIDYSRAMLLLAVLEKRGGLRLSTSDAYINVIGGIELEEPAADLATVLAIASSVLDRPVGDKLAAIGEVGLSGEIRSVSSMNQRLSEVKRLGFDYCVIPKHSRSKITVPDGLKLIEVSNVGEALASVLGVKRHKEQE